MKIFNLLFTILFVGLSSALVAQTVSGTVTDNNGDGLIGSSVTVKETGTGTITDFDGNYSLDANLGDVLIFSYTGFNTQEVIVADQSTINVILAEGVSLDAVTVVGSRGKPRTAYDAPVPVDNISAKTLGASGKGVLDQQLMFKVPSYNATEQPISDAAAHFSPADLRGLFPSRTLVLVNGKRKNASALVYSYVTPGRGEVGVDMKSIPSGALERVEILRDGAAAQYGSDAVAGVINLVLKKKTDPFVNIGYSTTTEGDGGQVSLEGGFGVSNDNGFANFTFGYFDQKRTQRAGEITSVADEAGYWGVSETSDYNLAQLTSFLGSQPSAGFQVGIPDMTITNFALNSGYTLDKETDTELYFFGNLANRNGSAPQFARVPYWVPGFEAIYPDNEGFFLAEMSPQIGDHSLTAGLRTVRRGWNFDISSTIGQNQVEYYITNSFNQSYAGSSPSNFYSGGHKFSHVVNNIDISQSFETATDATYTTAFGIEQRTERFETIAGEFASYGDGMSPDAQGGRTGVESFPGLRPENASVNYRNNIGAYAEITADFTKDFLIGGALRYENYSDFGDNLSWKLSSRYRIMDGKVNVRGSVSSGFRAPALHQIYYTALTTTLTANGVVQNGILSNDNPALRALGVEKLKAETAFNLGLGLTARLSDKVGFAIDAYQVQVKDRIVLSGQVTQTGDASSPIDQVLSNVGVGSLGFFLNAISTRTRGIDLVLNYSSLKVGPGTLGGSIAANFNKTTVEGDITTSDFIEQNGLTGNIFTREDISRVESWRPSSKVVATGTYTLDKFSTNLSFLYYGSVTYLANNEIDDATYGGKLLTDLSFSYAFTNKIKLTLGANNLFNVYPDTFADVYEGGKPTDRNLDFVGRFKYPWQTTQFGIDGRRVFSKLSISF